MKRTILLLALASSICFANANTTITKYSITGGESIDNCNITVEEITVEQGETSVTISGSYTLDNGGIDANCTVTKIGDGTKQILGATTARNITSLNIEGTAITEIGSKALASFTKVTSVTIASPNITTIGTDAFPSTWATNCTLIVPAESVEAYRSVLGEYFKEIVSDGTPTKTPGWDVPYITARPMGRSIKLSETADVQVYSITGASVYNGKTDVIDVEKGGIYIVKTKDNTTKVTVK